MSGLEQVLRFPEADLKRVLPGPGGVYRSPVPVPYVSLDSLTDPDPRISDNAFRTLRRLRDDIPEPYPVGWCRGWGSVLLLQGQSHCPRELFCGVKVTSVIPLAPQM
jgi:hypothetical protein